MEETPYRLYDYFNSEAMRSAEYLTYKEMIDMSGFFIMNYEGQSVKIYTPELALILLSKEIPVPKQNAVLRYPDCLKTYIEGYNKGVSEFKSEYSPNSGKDLHVLYFHRGYNNRNLGWNHMENSYPQIVSRQAIHDFGYYSGLISALDDMNRKHPHTFESFFDPCVNCKLKTETPSTDIQEDYPAAVTLAKGHTAEIIYDLLDAMDNKEGWKYAFRNESDLNTFINILTAFFEYRKFKMPEKIINLKQASKSRIAEALRAIHKELSNEKNLRTDLKFFNILRSLNYFNKLEDRMIYNSLTK